MLWSQSRILEKHTKMYTLKHMSDLAVLPLRPCIVTGAVLILLHFIYKLFIVYCNERKRPVYGPRSISNNFMSQGMLIIIRPR